MFQSSVEVARAGDGEFEPLKGWVDAGAFYSQFPAVLLSRLGYSPSLTAELVTAHGTRSSAPNGDVFVRIGEETHSVVAVFGEGPSEVLIGVTTLEVFRLAADPVQERLIPSTPRVLTMLPVPESRRE